MPDDGSPFNDIEPRYEYSRVVLTLACVATLMLVIAVLPVISPTDAGSPIGEAIVPTNTSGEVLQGGVLGNELTRGRLGALNPGQRTSVGGTITSDDSPFRSQDTDPHFTVQSPEPAYWRTGAFDTYTGSGWEQSGAASEVDGVVRPGREISYEVTLAQSASALPTVWQPRSVSLSGVSVTEKGVAEPPRSLSAGTGYSATSVRPVNDPEILRASGTAYPDAIERQYTTLPSDTSELESFTSELTADDETPYATARTVDAWLEANKSYSLNVSDPGGGDVASDFVLEMDKGYCEYFATSMAAMLRSQDIPARYVVGYSTGEATGPNEYTVRGMNAHAWVEVYFPDTGWVKFDPTPGGSRLQQERQSMASAGEDYSATEQGSPGEEFSVSDDSQSDTISTDDSTDSGNGSTDGESDSDATGTDDTTKNVTRGSTGETTSYNIRLNRTAVPGAPVAVTVSQNSLAISGATVFFNDRAIGTTNESGMVVATVPFESQLRVRATVPDTDTTVDASPADQSYFPRDVFRQQAGPTTTFTVSTNASVRVVGEPVTNGNVTVTAAVDDVPVRGGVVYVGSRQAGTTDADGNATVSLPSDPGTVTITVRRSIVGGNTTVTLPRLSVATTPTALVALPGVGHRVNATLDGEPAPNATVEIDGQAVTTTGGDGIATPSLPFGSAVTIAVSKHGQRATTTVTGLYRNLGGVAVVLVALLGSGGYLLWQGGISRSSVSGWFQRVSGAIVSGLVWLGSGFDSAIRRAYRRLLYTLEYIGTLITGQITPAVLAAALRAWFNTRVDGVTEAVRSVRQGDATQQPSENYGDDRVSIRDAWRRFVGYVSIEQYRTRTPGEISAHAVSEDGLPADAVRTIRDAFRAVEYGESDAESQLPAVEDALERIDATVRTEREGND